MHDDHNDQYSVDTYRSTSPRAPLSIPTAVGASEGDTVFWEARALLISEKFIFLFYSIFLLFGQSEEKAHLAEIASIFVVVFRSQSTVIKVNFIIVLHSMLAAMVDVDQSQPALLHNVTWLL